MNADIEIASFNSYRPSLNDIFVKAVGGTDNEEVRSNIPV